MTSDRAGGFDFAAAHDELRAVARSLLGPCSPMLAGGEAIAPDRRALADAGWFGLEVPETLGGAGATFAETAVVLEELGRVTAAGDAPATLGIGVGALAALAPTADRDRVLAGVATGALAVAVAVPAADQAVGPVAPLFTAVERGGRLWVDGQADFVLDAGRADAILLVVGGPGATPGGLIVARGTPGLTVEEQPVLDPSRRLARVVAHGVAAGGPLLSFAGDPAVAVGRLLDRAATAVACDSLGLAAAALDATVAYAGQRHQFGRPIGSFQAVKHACADMLVEITVSRELLRAAADAVVSGGDPVAVSRAKSYVTSMAVRVAGQAVQLHGGIGYTWERGLHVHLKRAALNRSLFGAPAAHRRRLAGRYTS
ncbi:MAG: acyl-CoA/acyl-ACP dehydrogenase [Actinomycetota bacterium]|nr:acyl-CoA/acyl-ACP dehydrogenase [Actinomycetota bacterium]